MKGLVEELLERLLVCCAKGHKLAIQIVLVKNARFDELGTQQNKQVTRLFAIKIAIIFQQCHKQQATLGFLCAPCGTINVSRDAIKIAIYERIYGALYVARMIFDVNAVELNAKQLQTIPLTTVARVA